MTTGMCGEYVRKHVWPVSPWCIFKVHLLFGSDFLPINYDYTQTLDAFQDPIGLETFNTIASVKTLIQTWTNGLHPVQLELVSTILDGQDIRGCAPHRKGKSILLTVWYGP